MHRRRYYWDDYYPDVITNWCRTMNIHEVCLHCISFKCKCGYIRWDGQMPPDIFCDKYEEDIFVEPEIMYIVRKWLDRQ